MSDRVEIQVEMVCRETFPGQTVCEYGSGPKSAQVPLVIEKAKAAYRQSVGSAGARALAAEARANFSGNLAQQLGAIRSTLRRHVRYIDDPPGLDTIQTLDASLRRGAGDCVSLTLATSVLAKEIFGKPGVWRIGGSERDPFEHIWNVFENVPIDASDPMPRAGEEFSMERKQNLGVGTMKITGRQAARIIAGMDTSGRDLGRAHAEQGLLPGIPANISRAKAAPQTFGNSSDAARGPLIGPEEMSFPPLPYETDMMADLLDATPRGHKGIGIAWTPESYAYSEQQWPSERRAGLTFGELSTLMSWLRNYGVPALTRQDQHNEFQQAPLTAVAELMARWGGLELARKSEFLEAYRLHVTMYGWDPAKGVPSSRNTLAMTMINWPLGRSGLAGSASVPSKISQIGREKWLRYVAAMAINRDLFVENIALVGGVEPGLVETLEDVQLTGQPVRGRWENLAGVWRWKGYDVYGRPLNVSEPLFEQPSFAPGAALDAARYNAKIVLWLLSLGKISDKIAQSAGVYTHTLTQRYNSRAKLVYGANQITQEPPPSVPAVGALLSEMLTLYGVDLRAAFGSSWAQLKPEVDKLPEVSVSLTSEASQPAGVSGMGYGRTLVREQSAARPGVGGMFDDPLGAASAAGASVQESASSSISAGQWLQASGQWAQALAGLTVGLYSADMQKKKNEQDAKIANKLLGLQQQQISQPAVGPRAPVGATEPGGEGGMGTTAVMLALGAVALVIAMGKSRAA